MAVLSEPLTYSEHSRNSFFRDLCEVAGCAAPRNRGEDAAARLARHQAEMRVEFAARAQRHSQPEGVEFRTNPNTTPGSGGEFAPPLWLVDRFASSARAGRPLADLCNPMLLPPGVSSVHTPRLVVGSTADVMSDGGAVPTQDLTSADASSKVVTIGGDLDVSQQLLEQSPGGFDVSAFIDLNRAYNQSLEVQLLVGTGTGNQLLGLSNVSVPAGNSVSGAGDSTVAAFWPHLGQVAANVGNNRFLPPEVCLMAPRRWFWVASSVDGQSRPVASPGPASITGGAVAGGSPPVGRVLGLPVWADGAIPAGASADTVYFVRPSDMFLWEGPPFFTARGNPLSETLQTRLQIHRAAAFIPHRYPSGVGFLTGLPRPTNF